LPPSSERNAIALSCATYSGYFSINSEIAKINSQALTRGIKLTLSCLPERRDGPLIFIQRNCEAVNFSFVLHNQERVVVKIAEEGDSWLYTPVVPVLL
jgi:hypothetical protein